MATALVAILLAAGCSGSDGGGRDLPAGPLEVGQPHGWSYTTPRGSQFTDGLEVLHLPSDTLATIDDVQLVGDEGLELIGAKIAPPPRPLASTQLVKTWPPRQRGSFDESTLVDAVGATIGNSGRGWRSGWELLVGMRVTQDGMLHRSGIQIRYHVGEDNYVVTLPAELMVCTDEKYERDGMCPFEA